MKTKQRKLAIGLTLGALVATPAAAFFWDDNVMEGVDHFVECWGYIWNDPEAREKLCSPGIPPALLQSIMSVNPNPSCR